MTSQSKVPHYPNIPQSRPNHFSFYHSQLLIAMKTDRTLPLTRCRLNSISDVLANLGGIFGLFIGGTTISLAEIVYFCCIRSVRVAFTQHRLHPATPKVFPWVP